MLLNVKYFCVKHTKTTQIETLSCLKLAEYNKRGSFYGIAVKGVAHDDSRVLREAALTPAVTQW